MHPQILITAVGITCLAAFISAQESKPLPDKIATLKLNYEAALVRATKPITNTYLQELAKLKLEYTKSGNLEAALAADAILKGLGAGTEQPPISAVPVRRLSEMTPNDFKRWLGTVTIVELGGQKTVFQYDGSTVTSQRGANPTPRVHNNVKVELGTISVPFSTDLAVIKVSDNLRTATVTYDDGPPIEAEINPKPKR
jgi:hypothetical protein